MKAQDAVVGQKYTVSPEQGAQQFLCHHKSEDVVALWTLSPPNAVFYRKPHEEVYPVEAITVEERVADHILQALTGLKAILGDAEGNASFAEKVGQLLIEKSLNVGDVHQAELRTMLRCLLHGAVMGPQLEVKVLIQSDDRGIVCSPDVIVGLTTEEVEQRGLAHMESEAERIISENVGKKGLPETGSLKDTFTQSTDTDVWRWEAQDSPDELILMDAQVCV